MIKHSQNGVQKTDEELSSMLKDLMKIMRRRSIEPQASQFSERKNLYMIGQLTTDALTIDTNHSELRS